MSRHSCRPHGQTDRQTGVSHKAAARVRTSNLLLGEDVMSCLLLPAPVELFVDRRLWASLAFVTSLCVRTRGRRPRTRGWTGMNDRVARSNCGRCVPYRCLFPHCSNLYEVQFLCHNFMHLFVARLACRWLGGERRMSECDNHEYAITYYWRRSAFCPRRRQSRSPLHSRRRRRTDSLRLLLTCGNSNMAAKEG